MKKHAKILAALLAAFTLCSCSRIPDNSEPDSAPDDSSQTSEASAANTSENEYSTSDYTVVKEKFIEKLNAEGGVFNGVSKTDGEFDGYGYITLKTGNELTHITKANTAQHYRIIIAARSTENASIKLEVGKKTVGAYFIPAFSAKDEDDAFDFQYYAVDSVYLETGANLLKFTAESGSADLDYLLIENSDAVSSDIYRTGTACVNPSANLKTQGVVKYLSDIYGQNSLTAQNVSPASNAEINAVYGVTERYPAIRGGELAYAVLSDENSVKKTEEETALALEWGKSGGLLSYAWHWYSPNIRRSVGAKDFDLQAAVHGQRLDEIAMFNESDLKAQADGGFISAELVALLNDADRLAAQLKKLSDANIPVLFQPIPDGDSGAYWWGADAESYKALWEFLFNRFCRYHKLKNLIWVWNGSDMAYYPGSAMVDAVGQSFYEGSNASFAGRLSALYDGLPTGKLIAVTSCDCLPSIDYMNRDNAFWVWTAAGSGEFTIDDYGALSVEYNSAHTLDYHYNSKLCITRDELPDFERYVMGE